MSPRPPESFSVEPRVRAGAVRNTHTNAVPVEPRIVSVLDTVGRECGDHLTASCIATRIGLRRSRFEHLFHPQTGQTFRAAVREARLARAARPLG